MPWVGAQIHFMMSIGNVERLCEFAWPRAKTFQIIEFSTFFHPFDSNSWFQGTNQNETILLPFHEYIQHPVHPVIEIDVGGASVVALDKCARAWTHKGVTGLVIYRVVGFRLNNHARAITPNQFHSNQFSRANERIALEKRSRNDPTLHLRHA